MANRHGIKNMVHGGGEGRPSLCHEICSHKVTYSNTYYIRLLQDVFITFLILGPADITKSKAEKDGVTK
jgi:hypothetical protein